MDNGVRGWMLKCIRANVWRTEGYCDIDDLMQEGAMLYHRLSVKYPNANKQQMQRLFETAYRNKIHDISKKRTKLRDNHILECEGGFDIHSLDVEHTRIPPDTSAIVASLPPVLKSLVQALASDPRVRRQYRRRSNGTRETTNERLCRIVGANPDDVDILSMLHDGLKGSLKGSLNLA